MPPSPSVTTDRRENSDGSPPEEVLPAIPRVDDLTCCLGFAMKLSTAHQPTGYVGRLQQGTLGWEVGRQISRNGNEDMPALVAIAPLLELPHARLEHLIGMEPGILSEQRLRATDCRAAARRESSS
jgi:hypothetical protein